MFLAIAAVLIVAVLIAALFATGILSTKGGGGSGTSGTPSTTALSVANAYANTTVGGPWSVDALYGFDLTVTHTISLQPYDTNPLCTSSGTQNYTVTGTSAPYDDGTFTTWLVGYLNASGQLAVVVSGNAVVAHYAVWGGASNHCSGIYPGPSAISTSGVSSEQAAAAARANGTIASFIAAHPAADARALLIAGQWTIDYTTCDFFYDPGAPALGANLEFNVNATDGAFSPLFTNLPSANCAEQFWYGQNIPAADLFAVGDPVRGTCATGSTFATNGCLAGDFTYQLTVGTSYLSFGGVIFNVDTSTGPLYNVPSPGGFSVVAPSKTILAQVAIPGGASMTTNGGVETFGVGESRANLLVAGDTIVLDMGTADPAGMGLGFSATISVLINGGMVFTPVVPLP
jgi:hypothetical protein